MLDEVQQVDVRLDRRPHRTSSGVTSLAHLLQRLPITHRFHHHAC